MNEKDEEKDELEEEEEVGPTLIKPGKKGVKQEIVDEFPEDPDHLDLSDHMSDFVDSEDVATDPLHVSADELADEEERQAEEDDDYNEEDENRW